MRRLLFVSYWVPPRAAVGSIRASHLLNYLPALGWDVTVITAPFGSGDALPRCVPYLQTGYFDLKAQVKRLLGLSGRSTHEVLNVGLPAAGKKPGVLHNMIRETASLVTYPDDYVGWVPFAARRLRSEIRSGKWDAVLSSAPPMSSNLALALTKTDIPWIADLRDLWAEDDSSDRSILQRLFDDRLERATLSRANALVASSQMSAARFQRRYPGKPCLCISTGFDPEEWKDIPFGTEDVCTLFYAGSLYRGKRDPTMLFSALRELIAERTVQPSGIKVDLYTHDEAWLRDLIARFDLAGVVRIRTLTDRRTVMHSERRADRLLLLAWDGPTAEGIVAGKLFEYFGAGRPILAVGGPAKFEVADMLTRTGAGTRVRSVEDVKTEIKRALEEHRNGAQRTVAADSAAEYTAQRCAAEFARVLNDSLKFPLEVSGASR